MCLNSNVQNNSPFIVEISQIKKKGINSVFNDEKHPVDKKNPVDIENHLYYQNNIE